ncbi:AAA family ATPase [Sorangium sp. So ce394]|uniref:AAA family ATPase n=1 Tax=Sorangium sp. So ce394 TaxID=3133310 RepID=UPI003F5CA0DE
MQLLLLHCPADDDSAKALRPYLEQVCRKDGVELLDGWIAAGEHVERELEKRLRAATHVVILVSARLLDWTEWTRVARPALMSRRRAEVSLVRWEACIDDADEVLRRFRSVQDSVPVASAADRAAALDAAARRVGNALRAARLGPRCGVALGGLPSPGRGIVGREQEKKLLDDALDNDAVHVVVVIGEGGAGKTQLVRTWLDGLQPAYGGVDAVISCSIEDQDRGGGPYGSAAVSVLLDALGESPSQDPLESVSRLVRRIRERRTLVVLDGLEPLQDDRGELIDRPIRMLVRNLASQMYSGLCVITTRPPFDLEGTGVRRIELGPVDVASAIQVLRSRKVCGSEEQLGRLAGRLRRHALSLALVADYLSEAHGGDVLAADHLDFGAEKLDEGGRIQRILSFYEARLKPEAHAVLGVVALCERPVDLATLAAVGAHPRATGFAASIGDASREELRRTCARLAKTALLLTTDTGAWDQHPLVRGYWRRRLEAVDPAGVRAAHEVLFERFRDQPLTAGAGAGRREDLDPLYAAVAHGVRAERWAESFEVLYDRIRQGERHTSLKRHGAVAEDQCAFLAFFDRSSFHLPGELAPWQRHWLENSAGVLLRAHGDVRGAVRLLESAVTTAINAGLTGEAAESARNLASVFSLEGDIMKALEHAESAVRHADASGELRPRLVARDFRAHLMHRLGRLREARAAFEEVEQIGERESEGHLGVAHHSFASHAVLLLDLGEVELAHDRAARGVELSRGDDPDARSLLSRGMAARALARTLDALSRPDDAILQFDEAVALVQQSGRIDHLAPCHIDCASFWAHRDVLRARRHLDEARRIYEGRGFRLVEAHAALTTARVALVQDVLDEAAEQLDAAEVLLRKTCYHVRVPWLFLLRARLRGAQGDHAGACRLAELARQEAIAMGLKRCDFWRELEACDRVEENT